MSKIPAWMADVNVKFISDEAKQRHPSLAGIADVEPRRPLARAGDAEEDKDLDPDVAVDEEDDLAVLDEEEEEAADEDFGA